MAIYKRGTQVNKADKGLEAFNATYSPGTAVSYPGIYRCDTCGHESARNEGESLPSENTHRHPDEVPIKWRLLVYAEQK